MVERRYYRRRAILQRAGVGLMSMRVKASAARPELSILAKRLRSWPALTRDGSVQAV
jgi:hypothetical protein